MTPAQRVILALALLSAGLFVAGIFVLFGLGWSLLAAAFVSAVLAVVLLKGLNNENQAEVAG